MDPIIAFISSYKEGTLIQGTIRSLLNASVDHIIIFDGPTDLDRIVEGAETDIGPYRTAYKYKGKPIGVKGQWEGEAVKRTEMLDFARHRFPADPYFWILTIDADEILVWGEYLRDWLMQLRPEIGEVVVPLRRTEAAWDMNFGGFITDVAPSRLIHSSLVKKYLVSCWRMETFGKPSVFEASHYRAERMPNYGEPHIHHRHYLRRPNRAGVREHEGEEREYTEALRAIADVIPNPENIAGVIDIDKQITEMNGNELMDIDDE